MGQDQASDRLTRRQDNYKAWTDLWRDKEKEVKKKTETLPHTTLTAEPYANFNRSFGDYRNNGFFYIRSTKGNEARREFYDKAPGAPTEKKALYGLEYGHKNGDEILDNFLCGKLPYKNQAHHLLPVKAFAPPHFNDDQLALISKLPYCVNHGQNVIFLPTQPNDCGVHNLPQHNGSHPSYNNAVTNDANELAKKMKKTAQDPCKPEKPVQLGVLKEMIDLQSDYWDLLTKTGAGQTVNQVGEARVVAQTQPAAKKRKL